MRYATGRQAIKALVFVAEKVGILTGESRRLSCPLCDLLPEFYKITQGRALRVEEIRNDLRLRYDKPVSIKKRPASLYFFFRTSLIHSGSHR